MDKIFPLNTFELIELLLTYDVGDDSYILHKLAHENKIEYRRDGRINEKTKGKIDNIRNQLQCIINELKCVLGYYNGKIYGYNMNIQYCNYHKDLLESKFVNIIFNNIKEVEDYIYLHYVEREGIIYVQKLQYLIEDYLIFIIDRKEPEPMLKSTN